MIKNTLDNSSMAFKLENGEIFLISDNDIENIASKLITEMLVNKQTYVYMHKDTAVEKCNLLYKIFMEQQTVMTDELKRNYLKSILNIVNEGGKELISMEQSIKEREKSGK